MRKWPTKWLCPLHNCKKNSSDYGVHGIQIKLFGLTVQCKNWGSKICTESQDITKKGPKLAFQTKPAKFDTFWSISPDSVHIALKLWLQVSRFEYHEPHNPKEFLFTYKGSSVILSAISLSENGPNLTFWVLIKYMFIQVFRLWTGQYQFQIFVFFTSP